MNRLPLLAVVALFIVSHVDAQTKTNKVAETNTLTFKLDISGRQDISNPTEDDVRAGLKALDRETEDKFMILSSSETTYIQAWGDSSQGFDLEYQEGDLQHHFVAQRKLLASETIAAFLSYLKGQTEWKTMSELKPLK